MHVFLFSAGIFGGLSSMNPSLPLLELADSKIKSRNSLCMTVCIMYWSSDMFLTA